MTDGEDITSSKVLRKLVEDEMFEAFTEAKADSTTGVTRVEGKAAKDGQVGWITLRGNAGTTFAELIPKYYSVLKECALNKREQGLDEARKLEVGETFQVQEGPKEEKAAPQSRIKCRAASDKALGWVSKSQVKSWASDYKVLVPTPLQDTLGATEITKTLRELARGEQFEYIQGPIQEGGELRMKGRAKKDGAVGYVTFRDEKGQRRLEC